jgi:ADP-ribose pyrophosphatase YjhB (NUDIX family)
MPAAEINRAEVDERLDRLEREYGDVPVRDERETVPAGVFPDLRALSREGYSGGSYVWVVREPSAAPPPSDGLAAPEADRERVLMVLGRGSSRWGLPGGGRECGENCEEAAVREVREETGIDCSVTRPFLVCRRVTVSEGDHDERLHSLWTFFGGTYEGGHLTIQPGELNGAAWFADPPERMQPENAFRAADWRR